MKYFFFLIIIFNIFFNKITYCAESYVVFKVNNQIITNVDIDNEYRYLIALNKNLQKVDKKKIMNLAKNSIVREKIKETELLIYYDLSKENKYINKIMEGFYKKLEIGSENEFKKYLLNYDLVYEEVKKKIMIEAAWNDLVYQKFSGKVKIDEEKIKKKIKSTILNKKKQKIYLISEILFNPEKTDKNISEYEKIKKSIFEIGFENSANLYSIADTSKLGGKLGWINQDQLSKSIEKEIIKLKIGEHTKPIVVPGGLLILKINDIKMQEENLDFDKEFKEQIAFEQNNQLDRYSKIYFSKIQKNSVIDEK